MIIWRRRHVKNSSKTRSIDAPVYDSIGNEYKVAFNPNTDVTIGISNDAYTTLNVGSMETIETHESRYMALGDGVTGRPRADTESTDPRGRSNTANSTTLLVPVDDEGYASLRSTQQLPYMSLSHGRDCNQGSGNDLSSGDVGGREGGEFDQLRSALESHRSSVDTNSNVYETLETPRPSIDMGVLRKQGSLGENEYEELDYTEINSNKDVDQSTKQQSPRRRIDAAPKSNSSEADAMANTNTDTTYNEVDDKNMIFNDLYRPSGSDFVECGRSSKTHIANTPTSNVIKQNGEERMSTYDKVDDATLLFNDLYQPSVMAEDLIQQVNDKIKRKASASSESAAHPNPYYFCLNPSDDTDPIRAHGVLNIRTDVPLAGMSLQTKKDDSSRENVDGKFEDIESPPYFTLEPPN
ncbi:uncharacterized protein LOC121420735 [Lytechinus variegatus]|uniref:uncharacterized protein LOC121420735 n=1 Tax=Lytechinus variegatus TaxID=7654 RepID=UPI001BB1516B|nr:uncharacterized protein LOC121420735 [Lytechinus variegatus]